MHIVPRYQPCYRAFITAWQERCHGMRRFRQPRVQQGRTDPEMAAAFLCAETGIEQATIDNSAAYIQSWLEELKNDKSMLILAAGQAQRAVNFILNRAAAGEMEMAI